MGIRQALKYMKLEEPAEGVAVVSFARSEFKNAVHEPMLDEMLLVLDEIAAGYPDRYRAVVLRGEGDNFLAGGDLEAFRGILTEPRHAVNSFIARYHQWSLAWDALPMPTIASLHGPLVGGATAMSSQCDFRYAAANTVMHFNFMQIGLVPDMGAHFILPSLVGEARAFELLMAGEPVTADEGYRLGLFTKVLPTREETDAVALARATKIAQVPAEIVRQSKQLLRNAKNSSLAETIASEVIYQTDHFLDPAFAEKIAAFFNKRSPKQN